MAAVMSNAGRLPAWSIDSGKGKVLIVSWMQRLLVDGWTELMISSHKYEHHAAVIILERSARNCNCAPAAPTQISLDC